MRHRQLITALIAGTLVVAACGDAPLGDIGDRASDWIAEPTILTTTTVAVTIPVVTDSTNLEWFNDEIESGPLTDQQLLRDEIFDRRGTDLIVQANRFEIAVLAPGVKFPSKAPAAVEYVTSQVVFERNGTLSDEPAVGFGLWSSEPYSRSRTVAQLVVLWVSRDAQGAQEALSVDSGVSCARFSDASTTSCELTTLNGNPLWSLTSSNGRTLVWFDGIYRYELFARNSVSEEALAIMTEEFVELSALNTGGV